MSFSHPSQADKAATGSTAESTAKSRAHALALRLLLGRPLSAKQLFAKLIEKGVAHEMAALALESMRDYGYIDDGKLADMVRASAARQGRGPAWIKHQLHRRGVAADLAAAAARCPEEETLVQATALVRRRFAKTTVAPGPKLQARALRFLASRGFASQTAFAAVRAGLGALQAEDNRGSLC